MAFYDEIAKDIQWEYSHNTDAYLKGDAYTTVMLIVGVDF